MKRFLFLLISLRAWAVADPSFSTVSTAPNDRNAQPVLEGQAAESRYKQILIEEGGSERTAYVVWAGDSQGKAAWVEVTNPTKQLPFVSYRVTYAKSPAVDNFCKRLEALSIFGTRWGNPTFYCF